jgi:hypothetical protein
VHAFRRGLELTEAIAAEDAVDKACVDPEDAEEEEWLARTFC